jgi:hypothetical protein
MATSTSTSITASATIPPWKARPLATDPFISYGFTKLNFYRPNTNGDLQLLLSLDAVDKIPYTEIFGLDYDTAIEANAIICGNRFDGRLARMMPDESCDVTLMMKPSNGILPPGNYYFCIPQQPQLQKNNEIVPPIWDYPVVKEFRDWMFPRPIPYRWANAQFEFRSSPSTPCCLTFNTYSTDEAHLIPDAEIRWFSENKMGSYGGNIGSEQNTITLRTDIHRCLDNARFTFIPKGSSRTVVCHFLVATTKSGSGELFHNYHDVPISVINKSQHFLFARFAYSLFKLSLTVCYIKTGSGIFKILIKDEEKTMTAPEMNAKWGPFAGVRSSNSRKRPSTTAPDGSAKDSGDGNGSDIDIWQPTTMNPTEVQERSRQLDDWLMALPEQQDDGDVKILPQTGPNKLPSTPKPRPSAAMADIVQMPILGSVENLQPSPASKHLQPLQSAANQQSSREAKKEN